MFLGVEPQIVSASRRTDIPAFFTPWWMQRVREGHVLVRNPRNSKQVIEVSLRAQDVVAVVYWSRNYGRLLPYLAELEDRGLPSFFHLTLTGYGPPLELWGPTVDEVVSQFAELASRYGPKRTLWRYDPIILGSRHDPGFHERNFDKLANRLAPFVRRCIISFLDPYPSTRRGLAAIEARGGEGFESLSFEVRKQLATRLVSIGRAHGMEVLACCENDMADVVPAARCIDPAWIGTFCAVPESSLRWMPTRKGCACAFARDVGAYQTCGHGCVYCYANDSPEEGLRNAGEVDPRANHLGSGNLVPQSPVRKKSFESGQMSLADLLGGHVLKKDEPKG